MPCGLERLIVSLAVLSGAAWAQPPAGFHWVNFKQEPDTVNRIAQVLRGEDYSAIREIGVLADAALVFTTTRETDTDTPDGDMWTVYSISGEAGSFRKLFSGYEVHVAAWLKFAAGGDADLGITYLDCSGCEPAMLFTALHYERNEGWRARWPAKNPNRPPGILLMSSDAGAPDTDEDVEQIWAVLAPPSAPASVGTWYHARNRTTGQVTNLVTKWQVGPSSREEEPVTLNGSAAGEWERTLCKPVDGLSTVMGGQDAKSCQALLHSRRAPPRH